MRDAVLAVMTAGLVVGSAIPATGQTVTDVVVELDFTESEVVGDFINLGSGFIGDHNYANPPADRIDPLNPRHWKWWRNVHRPYSYTDDRFQHGLGSLWTSQYNPGHDCGHPADPCSFPGTFREFCELEAAAKLAQGMNPRWDFWGEPGWPGVGGEYPFHSAADYAYWLRECALGLRAAYDDATGYDRNDLVLIAPSLWKWNQIYRVMFTQGSAGCSLLQEEDYFGPTFDCDANEPVPFGLLEYLDMHRDDLEVDLVSAHQFNDYMVQFWPFLFTALRDALDVEIADRGLNPMELTVNEYIGPSYNLCAEPIGAHPSSPDCHDPIHETENFLRPGHTVKGLAALHSGSVESAVKACWEDPTTGLSGCNEKALNGLLVGNTSMAVRPVWHAYRLYSEMQGHEISQAGILSTYLVDGEPFDPLGGLATRDDTLAAESYRFFTGYSNLMYQPELEIPGNDVYESFQGPYRYTNQVNASFVFGGLDPDCSSARLFVTEVSGANYIAPMVSVARVDRGSWPIVDGALFFDLVIDKNDAVLLEMESFSGDSGCLTDHDGDGFSDPVADGIFADGFESGTPSAWSAAEP